MATWGKINIRFLIIWCLFFFLRIEVCGEAAWVIGFGFEKRPLYHAVYLNKPQTAIFLFAQFYFLNFDNSVYLYS